MKFTIGSKDKPLRDVVLNREDLLRHAGEIARLHVQTGSARERRALLPRVAENVRYLEHAHIEITQYIKQTRDMVPAAEWFLDNYYLVKDLKQQILTNLPSKYERELPRAAAGQLRGFPRVYVLMVELVQHTDSNLQGELLKDFINAYQSEAPLSSGELWAIPIMLRIALLENIRRLTDMLLFTQNERIAAEHWISPFVQNEGETIEWEALLEKAEQREVYSPAYTERLLRRLRDFGPEGAPVLRWFDLVLAKQHTTAESLAKLEHQRQATCQVSMGHSITSVRHLVEEDWPRFFEEISPVEKALLSDPCGVYPEMDFNSRDKYRHEVEKLARRYGVSELTIARRVLELAEQGTAEKRTSVQDAAEEVLPFEHVGYYLIGKGSHKLKLELEQDWSALRHFWSFVQSWSLRRPSVVYFGGISALFVVFLYSVLLYAGLGSGLSWIMGVVVLVAVSIPLSNLAVSLLNFGVTKLLPPSFIPKLDLRDGIPEKLRTVVVIPTFLSSAAKVRELLAQMEIFHLSNQDPNLHFVLLGDCADSNTASHPNDEKVYAAARDGIKALTDKYGDDRFYVLCRSRQWNELEKLWMGWERKRGKIIEFNRLLMDEGETSFDLVIGNITILKSARYVITLDADTQLPRGSAKKLIGAMSHPLQAPKLNEQGTRVTEGYGILQPRIGVSILSAGVSYFSRIFSGRVGIDPYTCAISDVYQDLFGEGSFTGKGIYDLKVFHQVTGDAFPENAILSHDLLEGIYARAGLLTDVELIDGFPAKYHAYVRRMHRWVRGDWQILRWIGAELPQISRWKIFDNLRRSLEGPAQVLLIVLAFSILPGQPWFWILLVLLNMLLPVGLGCIYYLFDRSGKACSRDLSDALIQAVLGFIFMPYTAYVQLDAIVRSLTRQLLSQRKMLEWETAADTELRLEVSLKSSLFLMYPSVVFDILFAIVLAIYAPSSAIQFIPIGLLWLLSPFVATWISRSAESEGQALSGTEQSELRVWARKIWTFFEDFMTEEDNWLPPDNVQFQPAKGIAHRTSPTNIGLALLANLAARDFGYVTFSQMCERVQNTLTTLDRLEPWRGHLYNWYDTKTLEPLKPWYVSTVDSGNLAVYFITLAEGIKEELAKPVFDIQHIRGLKDTFELFESELKGVMRFGLDSFKTELNLLADLETVNVLELAKVLKMWELPSEKMPAEASAWGLKFDKMVTAFSNELKLLFPLIHQEVNDGIPAADSSAKDNRVVDYAVANELSLPELAVSYENLLKQGEFQGSDNLVRALAEINSIILKVRELCSKMTSMAESMDFTPLYDKKRQLFSIGYRINDQSLDKSYYDLLASEARQASYLAIALGDVPESHWFRMGRTLTKVGTRYSLASWSGTMFEYLMPLLVMRSYPGTLLEQTYQTVIEAQLRYGRKLGIPWGVSESGFYLFDTQRNYQYKAFGIPGLGLKRGLIQDRVIAPYASFLALMVAPRLALENLRTLEERGFSGKYGPYEAIDFTPERVSVARGYGVVESVMAHHLGMSFLALGNVLFNNAMQRRFNGDARIQSAELLLQERTSTAGGFAPEVEEGRADSIEEKGILKVEGKRFLTLNTADSLFPITHFLSNGQYSVMLTNAGSGCSKWREISVSRWREDVTRDQWGMYFYVHNLNSGSVWSATHQPWGDSGEDYRVTYSPDRAEFCRRDGNIVTKTEIVVSPEDQVEIRRISLTNHSQHDRTLEVTSYFETVLTTLNDDLAHPAFSNLFIQTEFENQVLLASRRPRREDQKETWLMHCAGVEGERVGVIQYETDRARFIGRGRTLARPRALDPNQPLSNTVGAVLDPVMSLRMRVRVGAGKTVKISYAVGIAESRTEAMSLGEKYQDSTATEHAFELAWTYSQVQLRHLNLSFSQANEALNMGGNLLYLSPCRTEFAERISQNSKGQSALWPYAISGDMPIVLARVAESAHLELIHQLIVVHEYWRLKGLKVDLVILNEETDGYVQTLQESLRDLVSMGHARDLVNMPGGVFILQRKLMTPEDANLLYTAARLVFSGDGGSCSIQVRKKGRLLALRKDAPDAEDVFVEKSSDQMADQSIVGDDAKHQLDSTKVLLFPNGIGGFSPDGKEYVIELKDGKHTPLPWVNVIANPDFGCVITESGAGYTWSGNSRENKLTPWSNDPVIDPHGEVLYLRDEDTGTLWNPTPGPVGSDHKYIVRHGQGYSIFEHLAQGIQQKLTVFVPSNERVKILELNLVNHSPKQRRLSATYYAETVMGVARQHSAQYLVAEYDKELQGVLCRNTFQEEFHGRLVYLAGSGAQVVSYTADRGEFIGRNGTIADPVVMSRETLSNTVGAGLDPCLALQLEITLEPGEQKTVLFMFGEGEDRAAIRQIATKYRTDSEVSKAFQEVGDFWDEILGKVQVFTPDKATDLLFNRWLLYQTLVCRLWSRSAFYQSGGAFGFRDQLQDVMALVVTAPERTRQQILIHCTHQFKEGDVQHWWHAEGNKGIRTKFSDDLLWLPYVTADYLEHTGDSPLLLERCSYLEAEVLLAGVDEHYSIPRLAAESGTVYEHCIKAIEKSLSFGVHGLPLIGSGDWNDGFSYIGTGGKGESVWLGWFLYTILQKFAPICTGQGENERAQRYLAEAEKLRENLEQHGWDGGWYRRAYFDDGTPVGSRRSEECQIDCIAQAWAVISGAARPSRANDAMLALEHYLLRRDDGLLLLLTPAFDHSQPNPGYIRSYVPGVRENGGQYTHGAVWAVLAWTMMGEGNKAFEVLQMLNPINHTRTEQETARYKTEPYVLAADVYATSSQVGRGGWSWYTGAAGWMYQVVLEGILGFRLQGDKLSFAPCIPKYWPGYRMDYKYGSTNYVINVENPEHVMNGVGKIFLDGEVQVHDYIQLHDDGKSHEVNVKMAAIQPDLGSVIGDSGSGSAAFAGGDTGAVGGTGSAAFAGGGSGVI